MDSMDIKPTIEDINILLANNTEANRELQIISLVRVVNEQEKEIESLKSQLKSSNGKKSKDTNLADLEKVT
jgi:hypothetical protein